MLRRKRESADVGGSGRTVNPVLKSLVGSNPTSPTNAPVVKLVYTAGLSPVLQ